MQSSLKHKLEAFPQIFKVYSWRRI